MLLSFVCFGSSIIFYHISVPQFIQQPSHYWSFGSFTDSWYCKRYFYEHSCTWSYTYANISLGHVPRNEIVELDRAHVLDFRVQSQTVSQNGCPSLHPHQQCVWEVMGPHPLRHLMFSGFFIFADWLCVKQYLTVALIRIFTFTGEHPFEYGWPNISPFFWKVSACVFCPSFYNCWCFSYKSGPYYVLNTNPLFAVLLFTFFKVPFDG